jgi:hypothetical protein
MTEKKATHVQIITDEIKSKYDPEEDYELTKRAEVKFSRTMAGHGASVSYKDHHITSGTHETRELALCKLTQLAMELWVDA